MIYRGVRVRVHTHISIHIRIHIHMYICMCMCTARCSVGGCTSGECTAGRGQCTDQRTCSSDGMVVPGRGAMSPTRSVNMRKSSCFPFFGLRPCTRTVVQQPRTTAAALQCPSSRTAICRGRPRPMIRGTCQCIGRMMGDAGGGGGGRCAASTGRGVSLSSPRGTCHHPQHHGKGGGWRVGGLHQHSKRLLLLPGR